MDQTQTHFSEVLLSWEYPEYNQHQRGSSWYLWYGVIAAFLIGIGVFTDNFLFAVIIILASIIIFLQYWEKPKTVQIELLNDGIKIADRKYSYRDIAEFWLAYNPPHTEKLYLSFESLLVPTTGIPLQGQNPLQIRQILLEFVPENLDNEDEPTSDALARILKI